MTPLRRKLLSSTELAIADSPARGKDKATLPELKRCRMLIDRMLWNLDRHGNIFGPPAHPEAP